MADTTGFRVNGGAAANFGSPVGKSHQAILIVDPDKFDFLLSADVADNAVDILTGIEHHGVVGAQFDGAAQAFGKHRHVIDHTLLLVTNAEKGPGGDTDQQRDAHG